MKPKTPKEEKITDFITNDKKFEKHINESDLSKQGERNVRGIMKKYCKLQKMTPTELIEEARREQKELDWQSDRQIKGRLIKFRKHLKNKKHTSSYARMCMQTVRTFYKTFEVDLPTISMKKFPVYRKKYDDILNEDDLRIVLQYTSPQMKAIILLMASSGLDSKTVRHITYKQFYDALEYEISDLGNNPVDIKKIVEKTRDMQITLTLKLERSKIEGYEFYTCCSPEATRAISNYLLRKPPKSLNSPLFRTGNKDEIINHETFKDNFTRLANKAKIGKVKGRNKFHAHGIRTYFATKLLKHNVQKIAIDFMLGHVVDSDTDDAYFVASREGVREVYESIVGFLILEDPTSLMVEPEELMKVRKELEMIEQKYEREKFLREKAEQESVVYSV